jgi:hypothetical protein
MPVGSLTDDHVAQYHREGYALIPDFLDPDTLAAAQAAVSANHPTGEQYFADPGAYPKYAQTQFSLSKFPFGEYDTNRLAIYEPMLAAARRVLGTDDIRLTKGELWAKYAGAIDYTQSLHRDFANHTLVVPRADHRYKELTTFLFLSDVGVDDGPTALLPRTFSDDIPLGINRLATPESWAEKEVLATGPAGSLLLYSYDVFHRGTNLIGEQAARFMILLDYRRADAPWIARQGWPDHGNHPRMIEFIERITAQQRCLFDIPAPGHEYWNEQTIGDMQRRYRGANLADYWNALGA